MSEPHDALHKALLNVGVTDVTREVSGRMSAPETGLPTESLTIFRGQLGNEPVTVWVYEDEIVAEWGDGDLEVEPGPDAADAVAAFLNTKGES